MTKSIYNHNEFTSARGNTYRKLHNGQITKKWKAYTEKHGIDNGLIFNEVTQKYVLKETILKKDGSLRKSYTKKGFEILPNGNLSQNEKMEYVIFAHYAIDVFKKIENSLFESWEFLTNWKDFNHTWKITCFPNDFQETKLKLYAEKYNEMKNRFNDSGVIVVNLNLLNEYVNKVQSGWTKRWKGLNVAGENRSDVMKKMKENDFITPMFGTVNIVDESNMNELDEVVVEQYKMSFMGDGIMHNGVESDCVLDAVYRHINNPDQKDRSKRVIKMTRERIALEMDSAMVNKTYDQDEELEKKFIGKKGRCAYEVFHIMNNSHVRVRVFMVDELKRCVYNNRHIYPEGTQNKNIPAFIFMCANNHLYVIDNEELRSSIAYSERNVSNRKIGAKVSKKLKEDNDDDSNKKNTFEFVPVEDIPETFQPNTNYVITCEKNMVEDYFYTLLRQGSAYNQNIKVDRCGHIVAFTLTDKKCILEHNPDYHKIMNVIGNLNLLVKEGEKTYDYEDNRSLHSLAMTYYERNYGHMQSQLHPEVKEALNNNLNCAFHEYWEEPTQDAFGFDCSKHYPSTLLLNKMDFAVFDPMDEIQEYNGRDIVCGYYYVKTNNYFPMRGCGWYEAEAVIEYLQDGIISKENIRFMIIPRHTIKHNHFHNFVKDIFNLFGDQAKTAINGWIGTLRKAERKVIQHIFTTSFKRAYLLTCGLENANVKVIESNNQVLAYHVKNISKFDITYTNIGIYRKVYDMSAVLLWRMVKLVGQEYLIGIHTDSLYFKGGNRNIISNDTFKINESVTVGEYRSVGVPSMDMIKTISKRGENNREFTLVVKCKLTPVEVDVVEMIKDHAPYDGDAFNKPLLGAMINGKAGTGKSYTCKEIKQLLNQKNIKYLCLSPTHTASLKVGGMTLHRGLMINPMRKQIEFNHIMHLKKIGVKVLLIDEISMISSDMWGLIYDIKTIGGFTIYGFGDFNQLSPVNEEQYYEGYKNSRLLRLIFDYNIQELKIKYRQINDQDFAQLDAEFENVLATGKINANKFGSEICDYAIAWTNKTVDAHNFRVMKEKATKDKTSVKLNKGLYLFKDLPVLSNVTCQDYLNNERFTVLSYSNKDVNLMSIRYDSDEKEKEYLITVSLDNFQKHFSPAYCMTVHKAQGAEFNHPYTIYQYHLMNKNMLYTALSRTKKMCYINLVRHLQMSYSNDDSKGYIYMYRNDNNGRVYIGSTNDVNRRKEEHFQSTNKDKFHIAYRANPSEFSFSIIKECDNDSEVMRKFEQYYINLHNSITQGYNTLSSFDIENQ